MVGSQDKKKGETMTTETRQELSKRAEKMLVCKASELIPKALNMFEKAIKDGDEEPTAKIVVDIHIGASGIGLCTEIICCECPFNSKENLQKLIDEPENETHD